MKVLFQPSQVKWEGEPGESLLVIAEKAGVLVDGSCGGTGLCGKCKVRIISGRCNPLTEAEAALTSQEIARGYRLACKTIPEEDLVVELGGAHKGSGRKKSMAILPEGFTPCPAVRKQYFTVAKPTFQDQRSDLNRVLDALGPEELYVDDRLLPQLHKAVTKKKNGITAVMDGRRILALEDGDTTDRCYGLAVDIGTTTVVGMLWDLISGENIAVAARTNPQSLYGADVISRIQYCSEAEDHLGRMQRKVVDSINDMIAEMTLESGVDAASVYDMTVVGNTTMSHLFLGIPPQPLAKSPFAPVFCSAQDRTAQEIGIRVNPLANVHLLPNIAGHVGSDISSVMLATELRRRKGLCLAIDIGTNGEILLSRDGEVLACSTAAGPAFEGAEIFMGMRAAEGAIERVSVKDGELVIGTIEDCVPVGICGSGLIDAVACLLECGIVDAAGRMRSREEAFVLGTAPAIAERITQHEGKPAFILAETAEGTPVILTQNDIREVQLAKGAIRAGAATMLRMLGESEEALTEVILAGAFGNYIDKHSAAAIGLLPDVPPEKIRAVGNAAGAGACMALLSQESRKTVDDWVRDITHVELSCSEIFQDEYIQAMGFPR